MHVPDWQNVFTVHGFLSSQLLPLVGALPHTPLAHVAVWQPPGDGQSDPTLHWQRRRPVKSGEPQRPDEQFELLLQTTPTARRRVAALDESAEVVPATEATTAANADLIRLRREVLVAKRLAMSSNREPSTWPPLNCFRSCLVIESRSDKRLFLSTMARQRKVARCESL